MRRVSAVQVAIAAIALVAVLFGIGWMTREDPADKPYLAILGGGFIFNYRVADVFYGFTAQVRKPVAVGSIIEAEFEDPGGGPPHVVSTRVNARTTRYGLRSPNVRGIEAGRPYKVVIRLYDFRHERLIETHEKTYASRIGDTIVPQRPLTIGPGYHRPPDAGKG
ncbi:MAG: hypothetical protein BroJett030_08990 [Alphaproteobacteria bacterium]|nr:MAG: hypothetical protein BroJett030_08990 [Alphaproteobacteria bacterium]